MEKDLFLFFLLSIMLACAPDPDAQEEATGPEEPAAMQNAAFQKSFAFQDLGGEIFTPQGTPVVYTAREFITMDPERPAAEAVAVLGDQFVAVGSLDEVLAAVGENARLDESTFSGKTVIPGFVEQHVHPVLAALTMNTNVISIEDWDAINGFSPAVRDPEGYEKRLVEAIEAHKATVRDKSQPFVTWGYHHYMHGDGMSRELLDNLAPDFPAVVWHRSCHEFFLNTVALEKVGITEAMVNGLDESVREQTDFGRGHFYEQGAMAFLGKFAQLMATPEIFNRGLEFTETYYHQAGITTACEPGGFFSRPMQDAINAVYSDDTTPFNHYFIADGKSFVPGHRDNPEAMVKAAEQVYNWGKGRTAFLPKQVKLFTDGAIYSQLMIMKDGYIDGHHGAWIMNPDIFKYAFDGYWDAGFQLHVHNNGDGGMDVLLNTLEEALERKPRADHRTVIIHFGFATPEQVDRAARLGAIVSSNPYYVPALASVYAELGVGRPRAENMVPMGDVVQNEMSFSFHSDMPMAPAKPLQLVWAAVNRQTLEGEVMGPRHKVSMEQALKAVTIEAAYSIQLENKVGSIEVGKDANLTILEQNPFEVDPMEIKDIGVWGTMLEGRIQEAPKSADANSMSYKGNVNSSIDRRLALSALQHAFAVAHTH